ncbi:MAG TPA: GFA family protein [Polyangiales bacterium]|nr:GFA family protein [Polyangiales bacterium]
MATRTYFGTCQCGRVRYQAAIDLSGAVTDTSDRQTAFIKSNAFRLLSGAADIQDNQFGMLPGHTQACRHCGIRLFGKGHLRRLGGGFYSINLATLENVA